MSYKTELGQTIEQLVIEFNRKVLTNELTLDMLLEALYYLGNYFKSNYNAMTELQLYKEIFSKLFPVSKRDYENLNKALLGFMTAGQYKQVNGSARGEVLHSLVIAMKVYQYSMQAPDQNLLSFTLQLADPKQEIELFIRQQAQLNNSQEKMMLMLQMNKLSMSLETIAKKTSSKKKKL